MEFTALVLFLTFYHLKPQEWFPWMVDLRPIQVIMAIGLLGLLGRDRPLRMKDLFRTPHDYLFFAYIAWVVICADDHFQMFKNFQVHIVTYLVTVHALTSVQRMQKLFFWWSLILMVVAGLAVASTLGFDPLDSYQQTQYRMKGRLILNLSIYNNPNTLAHSIVPVLPMLFFVMFWKRLFAKGLMIIMGLPLYCIFLTQSKGAFISAFSTVVAIMTFGRPKAVQIAILALAMSSGVGALYMLPRMTELNKSKSDPAIQGRIAALKFGLASMNGNFTGIGPGRFVAGFFKEHGYVKAAHNGYNQNGAELGKVGLWLFVALLYSVARTLTQAKTGTINEERIRRILFTMLISYSISCWMVDFAYRTTFFVLVAAAGAFHRHIAGINDQIAEELTKQEAEGDLSPMARQAQAARKVVAPAPEAVLQVPLLRPVPLGRSSPPGTQIAPLIPKPVQPDRSAVPEPEENSEEDNDRVENSRSLPWVRFGWIDFVITTILFKLVIRFWIHLINTM